MAWGLRIRLISLMAILLAGATVQADAKKDGLYPKQILIIRHAEKTGEPMNAQLSKKGLERADALFRLFEASDQRGSPFSKPDFILAARNSKNRSEEHTSELQSRGLI